ncbi:MAG: 3'-5' exonuclease [Chitinophagales bacterium]
MIQDIHPEGLFIFDIETAPAVKDFGELSPEMQKLFDDKVGRMRKEDEDPAAFYFSKAGIYAEFGKIICMSCGFIQKKGDQYALRIKTFSGHDERELLKEITPTLLNVSRNNYILCGHNIREFDVPWLCRRYLINGLQLPPVLDIYGKKPWEVNHLDTLDLWKFGDFKHYTSLHLLASILQVPTPKDDIDGSMVGQVYWHEDDLKRIATYCSKDVVAVAQVVMRLKGLPLIPSEQMEYV